MIAAPILQDLSPQRLAFRTRLRYGRAMPLMCLQDGHDSDAEDTAWNEEAESRFHTENPMFHAPSLTRGTLREGEGSCQNGENHGVDFIFL